MGLYEILFSQYGVPCGQLLVTEADMSDASRKARFATSLRWLLDAGCVPILINEYGNPSSPSAAIQYQFLLAHGSNGRVAGNRVTESAVAQQRRQPRLHFLGHAPFPFVQAPSELHDSLARLLSDPAALDALQGATSLWWNHSLLRLRARVVDRGRSSQCEHK